MHRAERHPLVMTTRVRFAPSPTGYLHLGSARTALFNWLFARHTGGKFLLRVEDTDLERSTAESRQAVLDAMEWLGLDYDEEMVLQSTRRDVHVGVAEQLLAEGKAYKCFCTDEELGAMKTRGFAEGRTRIYERTWRDRTDHPNTGSFAVRLKMPIEGDTVLEDAVLGRITVKNDDLTDLVILRSDGSPTYNFVVVIDDAFMRITHVIRGQDHTTNTFSQINLYKILGHEPPTFGHLPLIDGLSKRKGSHGMHNYDEMGFVSEAVTNYVARLGWSHGDDEVLSRAELIEKFTLEGVNRSSSTYDTEKFTWVNSTWIKRLDPADLAERLLPHLARKGIDTTRDDSLVALVAALQPRSDTLDSMADQARFAFVAPTEYAPKAVKKWMKAAAKAAYADLIETLEGLADFAPTTIEAAFEQVLERHELKMGKLAQPVRVAITGSAVSPPIDVTLAAVGQAEAVTRLRAAQHLLPDPQ
jgi:glutamyl-tRNA synthetase